MVALLVAAILAVAPADAGDSPRETRAGPTRALSSQWFPRSENEVFVITHEQLDREGTSFVNLRFVKSRRLVVDIPVQRGELGITGGVAEDLEIRHGRFDRFVLMHTPVEHIRIHPGATTQVYTVIGARVADLKWLPRHVSLEAVAVQQCPLERLVLDQLSDVQVSSLSLNDTQLREVTGATNARITAVDLRNNERIRHCDRLLSVSGLSEIHLDGKTVAANPGIVDAAERRGVKMVIDPGAETVP